MKNVLEFQNVNKEYCIKGEKLSVLDDINFSIKEGEIVALTGPSGSGKTTILNLVSNLITPTTGSVLVNGQIGYMFQRDHLFEWRSVYKNIILGLEITKKLSKENIQRIDELLKTYEIWDFKDNFPNELSGGMRQRVALIRTLAVDPSILLLDEPFAALDYQTKLIVCDDVYRIIKREKKATIIVTHDISEAISIADKVIVLSKRPAKIKKIFSIDLSINGNKTPFKSRQASEFKTYFDQIWKELDNN